jgi:hypothetical protein
MSGPLWRLASHGLPACLQACIAHTCREAPHNYAPCTMASISGQRCQGGPALQHADLRSRVPKQLLRLNIYRVCGGSGADLLLRMPPTLQWWGHAGYAGVQGRAVSEPHRNERGRVRESVSGQGGRLQRSTRGGLGTGCGGGWGGRHRAQQTTHADSGDEKYVGEPQAVPDTQRTL